MKSKPNADHKLKIDGPRRYLIMQVAKLSAAALVMRVGTADAACIDPDDLTGAQLSMRKDVGYQDSFPDTSKTCKQCEFYKSREGDCGDCRAIGGPVSAGGHCKEWMERTKK